MKKGVTPLLWTLVVINVVLSLVNAVFPNHIPVPILIPIFIAVPLAFALFHGAVRYQWSGILIFLVMCLVVSNLLENTSILTGFPFGHYYYTSGLGPKLFLVPLAIGPFYFGTGYLAWVLSTARPVITVKFGIAPPLTGVINVMPSPEVTITCTRAVPTLPALSMALAVIV